MKSISSLAPKVQKFRKAAWGGPEPAETAYEPFRHNGSNDYGDSNGYNDSSRNVRSPSPPGSAPRKESRSLKIFRAISCLLSALVAGAVVGLAADLIYGLENTKATRMLWSHGMMMKAVPDDILGIPIYMLLSAASAIALINSLAVLILPFSSMKRAHSLFRGVTIVIIRVAAVGVVIAALIFARFHYPNMWSWSCVNKHLEHDIKDNVVGLEEMCVKTMIAFIGGIIVAMIEAANIIEIAVIISYGRRQARMKALYPTSSRKYEKVDTEVRDQDEVPMLEVHRGDMG